MVFGFGLFPAVVNACSALEDGYKEFLLALFWDLSYLISLSLCCRWSVLSLGCSQCAQGYISKGPKQMEKQDDRTIMETPARTSGKSFIWGRITICRGYKLGMLHTSQQCTLASQGSIASSWNKEIVPLYSAFSRPHLKHRIQFCSPRPAGRPQRWHMVMQRERLRDWKLHMVGGLWRDPEAACYQNSDSQQKGARLEMLGRRLRDSGRRLKGKGWSVSGCAGVW